ncbi:uncharacterized protein PpBr36_09494 [Pyricularia pennisetigena]|uniref:uncharacterized protein n=1 Tax=Pyricularia pennisetigena TaxID=1578925 RepID=UPI00114F3A99|nr:uncharacterized protein PpBr36_09494 [Pyricularia pennisetigena]TLS21953.1 hypothetical protein PpBr36_09494 [Pyricularia pennisetigena]
MNTRPAIEGPPTRTTLSASFNSDSTCFVVGLTYGYAVFMSRDCVMRTTSDLRSGVGIASMRGVSNVIGLVGGGQPARWAPNKLILWNVQANKVYLEISTLLPIRGVQMSMERTIVVLKNSVRVYKFDKKPDLITSYETADNILGLAELSVSGDMLAFPGRTPGQVQLVNFATDTVRIIPAHSSTLAAIRFSPDGRLVATASEKGTLIRVFSTATGGRVIELRRGLDPAKVFSLRFNPAGTMLACTSDKGTLHLYDIPASKSGTDNNFGVSSAQTAVNTPGVGFSDSDVIVKSPTTKVGNAANGESSSTSNSSTRWGILGQLPLMPRYFRDVTSFAQITFASVDDSPMPTTSATSPVSNTEDLVGVSRRIGSSRNGQPLSSSKDNDYSINIKPNKGEIGWPTEDEIIVIGAGHDARWERFQLVQEQTGERNLVRSGWKRFMTQI